MKMFDLKFDINDLVLLVQELIRINDLHYNKNYFIKEFEGIKFRINHQAQANYRFSSTEIEYYVEEYYRWFTFIGFIRSYDIVNDDIKGVRSHSCLGTVSSNILSVFPDTKHTEPKVMYYNTKTDDDDEILEYIPEFYNNQDEFVAYLFQMSTTCTYNYNNAIFTQMINKIFPVLKNGEISLYNNIFELNSNDLNLITERLKQL